MLLSVIFVINFKNIYLRKLLIFNCPEKKRKKVNKYETPKRRHLGCWLTPKETELLFSVWVVTWPELRSGAVIVRVVMESMEAQSTAFQSPSRSRFTFHIVFFSEVYESQKPLFCGLLIHLSVSNCISTSPWTVPYSKWYFSIFHLLKRTISDFWTRRTGDSGGVTRSARTSSVAPHCSLLQLSRWTRRRLLFLIHSPLHLLCCFGTTLFFSFLSFHMSTSWFFWLVLSILLPV